VVSRRLTILIFVLTMGWFIMFLCHLLVAFSLDVLEHDEEDRSSCADARLDVTALRCRAAGTVAVVR
jgi:hypothetical protein